MPKFSHARAYCMAAIILIGITRPELAFGQTGIGQGCDSWMQQIPVQASDVELANTSCLEDFSIMGEAERANLLDTYLTMNGQFLDPLALAPMAAATNGPSRLKLKAIEALSARRMDVALTRQDIDVLLQEARSTSDMVSLATLNFAASAMSIMEGDFAAMREYAEAARDSAVQQNMLHVQPKIYNSIGVSATVTGDYTVALENYQKAIEIAGQTGNQFRLATVSANIGNMFSDLGDDDQAMMYYGEALTYASSTDRVEPIFTAGMLTNIASIHTENGDHEAALPLYKRATQIMAALPRRELDSFLNYSHARSLHAVGQTDQAMELANASVEQSVQMQDTSRAATTLVWLAERYLEAGAPRKAQAMLERASTAMDIDTDHPETLLSGERDLIWTMNYAESMATVLARTGEHSKATRFSEVAFKLSDDRFEQEKINAAVNAELLFNLRARQNELDLSNAKAALASQQATLAEERATISALHAERSNALAGAGVIGGVIAALFGVLAFRSYRAQKNLADAKQMYLQETQHRVKNNLQLLASILRLDARKTKINESLDIRQDVTNRIRTMGLIQDHLYHQGDKTTLDSHVFLSDLLDMIEDSLGQPNIKLEQKFASLQVDVGIVTQLGLALSELVSNAYKHAFDQSGGTIFVTLEETDPGRVTLMVRDTGLGFQDKGLDGSDPTSVGMELIEGFAETLGSHLEIVSTQSGTCFSIRNIACTLERQQRNRVMA